MAINGQKEVLNPIHPNVIDSFDPEFIKLYNEKVANIPAPAQIDLRALRSSYSTHYSYGTAKAPIVECTYDKIIPVMGGEIPLRIYQPHGNGPWPVHIDYHGGGWVLGDLDVEAHLCKHYSHDANVVVIDVGYRLAPDFPFPTAIFDSFSALLYIHSHAEEFNVDPSSISLGGLSAGGFIALTLCILAKLDNISLKLVVVGSPTIDDISKYSLPEDSPFASMKKFEFAPTLNWHRLKSFDNLKWSTAPTDPEARRAYIDSFGYLKNLLEARDLSGLPRTVIFTAGADLLRDEGEAYAKKLQNSGVEVRLKRYEGVPHPFQHLDQYLTAAKDFVKETIAEIKAAHYG